MTQSSDTPIISVWNLSKSYKIGGPKEKYKRLTESVTDAVLHLGKWLSFRTGTQEVVCVLKNDVALKNGIKKIFFTRGRSSRILYPPI